MNLTEMRSDIRIELSDSSTFFSDDEIDRGVLKCVSLMSRFIPKRVVLETTIVREYKDKTLTIASDTGTLANKPVKVGSLSIPNKTLDTDYTINYLTGVVTEINSLLTDGDYTVAYDLDPLMLNIDTLLSEEDYIRIERIESPVGNNPPTYLTYDVFGEFLLIKGSSVALTKDDHLRIIYLKPWTAPIVTPTVWAADTVIALDEIRRPTTSEATGYYYKCTIRTGDFQTGANEPTWNTVLGGTTTDDVLTWTTISLSNDDGDYPEHLDDAVIIGSAGQTLIFKAEKYVQSAVTALSTITAPTLGTFSAPTPPDLPSAPSAPSVPSPDYSAAATALTAVGDEITAAKVHHTAGVVVINKLNVGARVAEIYGTYADGILRAAGLRVNEGLANISRQRDVIALYASEVASYASEVSQYASLMSGTMAKYGEEVASEGVDATFNSTMVAKYVAEASEQEMKARNWLDIAGRYLASGQAKINEFLAALGIKPEYATSRSSSEQRG